MPPSPPQRSSTKLQRKSRRSSWSRSQAAARTFEAYAIPCRSSSHPPLVIGSFNHHPNRGGGTAHRIGEGQPECLGTDFQLFGHATYELAACQITENDVPRTTHCGRSASASASSSSSGSP